MKSNYIIRNSKFTIRPMTKRDVFAYLDLFDYNTQVKNMYYKKYKDVFENQKEDDPRMFFVVLKYGKIIGEIATSPLIKSPCDATVKIVLPQNIKDREDVENLFIKLCLETYLYDDIYIVKLNGTGYRKELISDSTRRKAS